MTQPSFSAARPAAESGAQATLRIGTGTALEARITTSGLIAVAAIVGTALLGSAAIVLAARRAREAAPPRRTG